MPLAQLIYLHQTQQHISFDLFLVFQLRLFHAQSNSLTIDKWYIDEAFSGKTDKRPAFLEMIEAAKAGKIRKVIVHKLDRFSRSMADTVNYRGMFRDLDVELISVAEDFEHTPAGNLMTTMIAAFNQYYVENLATEVMKGMTETAIQGMWTGGKPPLGYDVDEEQRLVLNPQEAAVVRTIFEMIAAGYGYARIANTLNEAGCRPFCRHLAATRHSDRFVRLAPLLHPIHSLCTVISMTIMISFAV